MRIYKEKRTLIKKSNEYYPELNGLRTIAALSIVVMHIEANSDYQIEGFISSHIISTLGNFVMLFMMISAFSMCCGYYEKFMHNDISLVEFYGKRWKRVWPFFALLVLIDLLIEHNLNSLYEAFADLTLTFSLLPNPKIEVIGIGWFLGIVFLFYMLFPFFCFLLKDKKTAWLSFVVCILYHFVCEEYFLDERHVGENFGGNSFLWYAMYFMAGGLIWLYRVELIKLARKVKWLLLIICLGMTAGYFWFGNLQSGYFNSFWLLITFSLWLIYTIACGGKLLDNKITGFISNISMEIYLCHMLVFRVVEKIGFLYIFGNGWIAYLVTCIIVVCGAVFFAYAFRYAKSLIAKK